MARKAAKSEWQVRAEAAKAEAVKLQTSWDAAARACPSLVPPAMDSFQGEAVAEDAERLQRNWSNILEYLTRDRDMATAKVLSFQKDLAEALDGTSRRTALEVLSWSTDALRSAATAEVYGHAYTFLTDRGPTTFRLWLQQSAARAARDAFPRSSSAMSNLSDAARAESWANLSDSFVSGWLSVRF
jgi:hypothetical protein